MRSDIISHHCCLTSLLSAVVSVLAVVFCLASLLSAVVSVLAVVCCFLIDLLGVAAPAVPPTVDRVLDLGFLSVSSAWQGKGVATMLASKAEHLAR